MDIHTSTTLGFSWGSRYRLQYYEFTVFPLAYIATACYVFTKILRLLIKHWRIQGLDGMVAINRKDSARSAKQSELGLIEHTTKYTCAHTTP